MPDIREVLDAAAPDVTNVDAHLLLGRARRRHAVSSAEKAVGAVLVVALLAFVAAQLVGDDRPRRVITRPAPTSTVPVTTTFPEPAYVDPSPSDPALQSELARCTADDLQFSRSEPVLNLYESGVHLYFAPNRTSACALLSYPTVEGLTDSGTWERLPVRYADQDAISSFLWEGVFAPSGTSPAGYGVVVRLWNRLPSFFGDDGCPEAPQTPRHYTSLRFVLRDGGGTVEIPDVAFDTGGCVTFLTRFGFESHDGEGVAAGG